VAHTAVAGVDALCFLLALGFVAARCRGDPAWASEGCTTAGFLLAGVVLGGFGAASITQPYAGLAERLSIGTFLLWAELMAIDLWRLGRPRRTVGSDRGPSARAASPD